MRNACRKSLTWAGKHMTVKVRRHGMAVVGTGIGLFVCIPYVVLAIRALAADQRLSAGIWFGVAVLMPTMGGGLLSRLDRRNAEIDTERRSQGRDG